MRVKLTLIAEQAKTQLPFNYSFAIAALIYRTLGQASAEFAAHLHDEGFISEKRKFKLFTFSRLGLQIQGSSGGQLKLADPSVTLQVSSPVSQFVENFVKGLFKSENFVIANAVFKLANAETLLPPEFTERMTFRALSPVTEMTDVEGSKHGRFLDLSDDWSELIRRNLLHKHYALHGRKPEDDRLHWTWDSEYIAAAERRGRRLSALTDIHGIKVRGWLVPFTVEGSRELIELGYEAGFGNRNSMGHGMAEKQMGE
jgi:CRISPR-associated endoribonuclease Cas6